MGEVGGGISHVRSSTDTHNFPNYFSHKLTWKCEQGKVHLGALRAQDMCVVFPTGEKSG